MLRAAAAGGGLSARTHARSAPVLSGPARIWPALIASSALSSFTLSGCMLTGEPAPDERADARCLEHVALGEMTDHSAVLWARETPNTEASTQAPTQAARRYLHALPPGRTRAAVAPFLSRFDDTARVRLTNLHTGSLVVWSSHTRDADEPPPEGCAPRPFTLAPAAGEPRPVRFVFGGDVGGQNVCRDAVDGFPTLPELVARPHDFRVLLGDMIYADDTCLVEGAYGNTQVPMQHPPLPSLETYRAHWRYAQDDAAYRALRWGAYVVWDDHETVNDAGPHHDRVRSQAHVPLMPLGRRGLLEHDALDLWPDDATSPLHRRFRWGRHLELVLLDTRSHRDDGARPDDAPTPKSLLGAQQRDWLADVLRSSDATWIVVVSSVPIALPTGAQGRRDSWADGDTGRGYVRELRGLLEVAQRARRQLVFITTDVHFTAAFEHRPFADDPSFVVHELVTGPLSAGLFPFDHFDTTLGTERVLHHVPREAVHTLSQARPYFTWGEVAIDAQGALTLSARNTEGELWRNVLAPTELAPTQLVPAQLAPR